ncbi:histidine kinase [uncultured Tenacibaculum sp.]|uniref:tetratricopeptide repeat-containing sensor histidine kinase n=1 Tax=uncultured Tenacibaculum sp. TaxID=174713 RepID=UPI0026378852|nr:histidine kinase [uncultured Tenacibaculum sp.]
MRVKIKYLLYLFVFITSYVIHCQSNSVIDSTSKYKRTIDNLEMKEQTIGLSTKEYLELARSYNTQQQQYKSLIILDKLIFSLKNSKDLKTLAKAYNLKAESLVDLVKVNEGVEFCDEKLTELSVNKDIYYEGLCLKCGILYNEKKQFKSALNLYNQIKDETIKSTPIYLNYYGLILSNNGKYDEALTYFKKSIQQSYIDNKLKFVNVSLTNMAKIFILKKEWKKAQIHLDSGGRAMLHTPFILHRRLWLHTYYDFFLSQDELDNARRVLDRIEVENSSYYDYKIKRKMKELDAINSRKSNLTKKVTVINNNIKITNEKKLKTYLILLSLITLLTGWTLLKVYKNIQLKYKKVINEQELLSSQMTPHFIFNSLSILQGMLLNEEKDKATQYIEKFSNILKSTVKEKTQKFIAIKDEVQLLQDYIAIQNLSTSKNIQFTINIDEHIDDQFLIPSMILQPFVENSIIHGFKTEIENPTIQLSFKISNDEITCTITDNGIGFSISEKPRKNQQKTSLATQIVKERLSILSKKMNHNFSLAIQNLEYKNERGTEVIINLPFKNLTTEKK